MRDPAVFGTIMATATVTVIGTATAVAITIAVPIVTTKAMPMAVAEYIPTARRTTYSHGNTISDNNGYAGNGSSYSRGKPPTSTDHNPPLRNGLLNALLGPRSPSIWNEHTSNGLFYQWIPTVGPAHIMLS